MPPQVLRPFLLCQTSLTQKIEQVWQDRLRVVVVQEGFRPMRTSEKPWFGYAGCQLGRPSLLWVRRAYLYAQADQGEPDLLAESFFPLRSLKGEAQRLRYLRARPIGYLLFKRQKKLPLKRQIDLTPQGWRRQTLYDWHGRPLLIREVFLSHFVDKLSPR